MCISSLFRGSGFCFILVYVDDLLVLANTAKERDGIIKEFQHQYNIRVLDDVEQFLGVQLKWRRDTNGRLMSLSMSQPLYIDGISRRFGMKDSKPAHTPLAESFFSGLSSEVDKSPTNVPLYQQMIGSLLYLALRTCPNILVPVLILARFQSAPTQFSFVPSNGL